MITEYKDVNGIIVALDNNSGIIELDKQNNINEIIESKNTIEEIKNTILNLQKEKTYLKKYKKSFIKMFLNKDYNIETKLPLLLGFAITMIVETQIISNPILTVSLLGFTLISETISLTKTYNKYKKTNLLKINNINEQIKDFENDLIEENNLLNKLLKNKKNTTNIEKKVIIDNNNNKSLTKIQNKKKLYETYRENCLKIKKQLDKFDNIFDKTYSNNDINYINKMHNNGNKVLSKRKD